MTRPPSVDRLARELAATGLPHPLLVDAARRAIAAGDPAAAAGEAEAMALLRDLFATSSPVSSPSGRPTYVEFNHGELARRFQK